MDMGFIIACLAVRHIGLAWRHIPSVAVDAPLIRDPVLTQLCHTSFGIDQISFSWCRSLSLSLCSPRQPIARIGWQVASTHDIWLSRYSGCPALLTGVWINILPSPLDQGFKIRHATWDWADAPSQHIGFGAQKGPLDHLPYPSQAPHRYGNGQSSDRPESGVLPLVRRAPWVQTPNASILGKKSLHIRWKMVCLQPLTISKARPTFPL
jgi:hypothetical protein